MCDIFDSDPEFVQAPPTETTNITKLPPWLEEAGQRTFEFASDVAGLPYQPYTGERVAPLAEGQQQAINLGQGTVGAFQPYIDQASGYTSAAVTQFPDVDIQQYMNPYIKGALDPTRREIEQSAERLKNAQNAASASRGAFGGSRSYIQQDETNEKMLQAVSDLYARGYSGAFDRAADLFTRDRATYLPAAQEARQQGALTSQLNQADIEQLLATGALERGIGQASLDTAYGDFLEQRDYPRTWSLDTLLRSLSGVPYPQSTTSTTTGGGQFFQQPSTGAQIAGLGLTGLGIYGALP